MAATTQERTAKTAVKRQEVGEVERRYTVRPGIEQMLIDLMTWHNIEERSEAVQLLILNARPDEMAQVADVELAKGKSGYIRHYVRPGLAQRLDALTEQAGCRYAKRTIEQLILAAHRHGPAGSVAHLAIPLHEITVSKNVAQKIRNAGLRESYLLARDEDES